MLVRVNVKPVEPTKTSGGRETAEGATLRAKSKFCGGVGGVGVENVVEEVVYVVVAENDGTVPSCWYTARMVVVEFGTVIVCVCP